MYPTNISNFPSLTPFRLARKQSPAKNLDLISRSFDENLLTRLKPLIFTAKKPKITLSFLSLAVDILSSTHREAETLFSELKSSFNLEDPLNLYLDDSIKLLDICNSISSEIEHFQKNRLLINFVLNLLDFSDQDRQIPGPEKLRRAKNSLSDWMNYTAGFKKPNLQNAEILIGNLAVRLEDPPRGMISNVKKLIHRIIYAVAAVTVLITRVVVSALTGSPMDTRVRVPSEFIWAETFNGLESTLFNHTRNLCTDENRRFIDDLDDVDSRVRSVYDVIDNLAGMDHFVVGSSGVHEGGKERLLKAVKELKMEMTAFSDGLDRLFNGVNVLFDSVLCARESLLEKFRVGMKA
ncbi:Protein BYPASS-related [Macleaya cordata]|uniref:Protein BYPASS-related n=1 Tax=Macleaya cordata TaxID=56857 RepID=A0A200QNS8_MACCD|nr:Protein BYPASS-related [Macleaya cordata]